MRRLGRARYHYLLDLDEDLASRFDMRMRLTARPVITARVCDVPSGEFDLEPLFSSVTNGLGLLVVDGIVELDTQVGDRTASELIGEGDLLCPWESRADVVLVARRRFSRALLPLRIAVLDEAFSRRAQPWPQITNALIQRGVRRAMALNVQRAATCHPRADVRVALLLWQLAERWGTVQPDGIHLSLPLTHRLIGQLVGAERPSVSHALTRLSRADLVTRCEGGLLLHRTADHHLACLLEPHRRGRAAPPVGRRSVVRAP
jgi:CRP/FNR family transcriptional regulator, cyclic AMP receptor protein